VLADVKLPDVSHPVTVIVCVPEAAFFVFQVQLYGAEESVHFTEPST